MLTGTNCRIRLSRDGWVMNGTEYGVSSSNPVIEVEFIHAEVNGNGTQYGLSERFERLKRRHGGLLKRRALFDIVVAGEVQRIVVGRRMGLSHLPEFFQVCCLAVLRVFNAHGDKSALIVRLGAGVLTLGFRR